MANVAAKPEPPLARLHKITAEPTMIQRENPIGEQTENWCADHVSHEKRVAEQTGLGHGVYVVSCEKSCANIRFERGQNLPVDVIEKINSQEQKECASRAAQRLCPCSLHQQLPIAVCRRADCKS